MLLNSTDCTVRFLPHLELLQTWCLKNLPMGNRRNCPTEKYGPQQDGEHRIYCAPDAEKSHIEDLVQTDGVDCVHAL